ncbi:VOC family protein [Nocardia huaxiensis]|uniref:VOC family protein n=1 Tax=Nocardia huaxiensis TaxID=2755382 RepID=A0A7D6ZK64_9NOCA|nr:VOC family protein [Nocardia huaxiensis]QLY33119.1 VOC family protein [Nocardia huaxiensis]UFS93110.1 VOC family protein [Nocardia huaxiensis]
MTAKDLTLTHVSVLVGDQQEALEFYRDVIGLEVRQDMPFIEGARWITVGPAAQPAIEFVLESPSMVPVPEMAEGNRARIASGAMGTLFFATEDVDATFARLSEAGVPVEQPLVDQPYGVRDCGFRDPWGNHLRFAQPLG